jgi:hypothetical protein
MPSTDNARNDDDAFDIVPSECLGLWMDMYLSTVPESHHVYVQPDIAIAIASQAQAQAQGWFSGVDKIAGRVLITAGRNEVLYGSIVRLSRAMEKVHRDVQLDVQEGGVHCDVMFDIGAKSKAPHPVERRVVDWLAETLNGGKA